MKRVILAVVVCLCGWMAAGEAAPKPKGKEGSGKAAQPAKEPPAFAGPYIVFFRDPLTAATVHWLAAESAPADTLTLLDGTGTGPGKQIAAEKRFFPVDKMAVRVVELSGLKPGTEYRFTLDAPGAEKEYRFRTLPADAKEPLRIAVGGDMMHETEWMEATCKQAAKRDVHMAILGGDLFYENGDLKNKQRIYDWLGVWTKNMRDSAGRLIPFIVTIGNHEVQGDYGGTPEKAPFFFSLFALPEKKSNYIVDAGNYLSVVVLDTDHVGKIEDQEAFLKAELPKRKDVAHLFCVYHWPVYGTAKDGPDPAAGPRSTKLLKYWVPHFEANGVDVCFEHDHHTYKRSPLIKGGKADPKGILYIGDGCWGVKPRAVVPDRWYHVKTASTQHFILCTIQGPNRTLEAITSTGETLDRFPEAGKGWE
jgi:hypothetical protein